MDKMRELVFTDDSSDNWLYKRYYYDGANFRYWSFQTALNLLVQRTSSPTIIETGCQRQKEDLGAGMSTSLFGEYCKRYGGRLFTVDLISHNLEECKSHTIEYKDYIEYILSDSIQWLSNNRSIVADLLYLDSWDHPHGELLNCYGGQTDTEAALKILDGMTQEEVLEKHGDLLAPCQNHCLNEFIAAEQSGKLNNQTVVLIDDNQLSGGGKSRLVKDYLVAKEWICLFDLQQSLWIKEL